jgi:hypothetical protein
VTGKMGNPAAANASPVIFRGYEMIDIIRFVLAFEKASGSWKFSLQVSVG